LAREIGRRDLTLPLSHKPGEKLQLDYAGKTMPWVDRQTGEVRQAQVLIGVMPYSQHTFAIALPSQCTADFVHGINEALRFFGGVPKVILSDNLKAFVIKSDRYDPDFNDVCVQLGNHYQLDLQAARAYKPKDKASVENAVRIAYTRLYAPLRNQIFHRIEEINAGLREQLAEHQNRDFTAREGTRLSCFTEQELPLLGPLPTSPFLLKKTVSAKVQRTYHVQLGERKNFYSVPFQYVGQAATILYSRDTVEIFNEGIEQSTFGETSFGVEAIFGDACSFLQLPLHLRPRPIPYLWRMTEQKYTTIHYHNYLEIDKLLSIQNPRSAALGEAAHDETLFIIMHQVYELWFKQIMTELDSVTVMFREECVNEDNMNTVLLRLKRISTIISLMVEQIHVMETLTPLDFLDFRDFLFPASGFQSMQFRMIEATLGLREEDRMTYHGKSYKIVFDEEQTARLEDIETSGSLFELVEGWLERTPFLRFEGFDFLSEYKAAVDRMLAKEQAAINGSEYLDERMKAMRLKMLGDSNSYFKHVLSRTEHERLMAAGECRMSYKATIAALLINLYRDKPILNIPFNLLTELMNIDELLTTWRYRHAQMVMRMIGNKIGTGGSSGHDYLAATAEKHKIFRDLHNISSLLIPRSSLPALPEEVERNLGFYFGAG
jgi:tryptophan 2,3-dioxygenase